MGQFSWMYADTNNKRQMIDNKRADSYLLVPPPFQSEYGKTIYESCYDGYGHFGSYDVHDLITLWNKQFIDAETFTSKAFHEPVKENYGGLWNFDIEKMRSEGYTEEQIKAADEFEREENWKRAMNGYMHDREMLIDFCSDKSHDEMKISYGSDYLRYIGIMIACYDEDNMKLPFPIKITTKEMDYNSVGASRRDPNQGWETYDDEDDEEVW